MIRLLIDLLQIYNIAIIVRAVLSWFTQDRNNKIYEILYKITEPVLGPIRRVLPATGGFDFSPVVAMIAVQVVIGLLYKLI
ncbi:MAG TPA: YggT family protein [Candidatus Syntrophosphaera sp.]|jgi:YggT family protein|nr:YggT family protein [Candidatus Syntrophosphaera sp.]